MGNLAVGRVARFCYQCFGVWRTLLDIATVAHSSDKRCLLRRNVIEHGMAYGTRRTLGCIMPSGLEEHLRFSSRTLPPHHHTRTLTSTYGLRIAHYHQHPTTPHHLHTPLGCSFFFYCTRGGFHHHSSPYTIIIYRLLNSYLAGTVCISLHS